MDDAANTCSVSLEVIIGDVDSVPYGRFASHPGTDQLSGAWYCLQLDPVDTDHVLLTGAHGVDVTRLARSLGNEGRLPLFWKRDEVLLEGLVVDVAEMDVVELEAAYL